MSTVTDISLLTSASLLSKTSNNVATQNLAGYSAVFKTSDNYVSVTVRATIAGESISVGVLKTGTTGTGNTFFDDFRVEYYSEGVLFLDEDQPDMECLNAYTDLQSQTNSQSLDVIQNRTLHPGLWSTICLPSM